MTNSAKLSLTIILILFLLSLSASGAAAQEECINVSMGRVIGIGAWLAHGGTGFTIRYWANGTRGLEMDLLAPPREGRLRFLVKGLNKIIDTCFIDGYIAIGAEIPIGDHIDWQRFDLSGGAEWSFPTIPQLAISLEMGVSVAHDIRGWSSQVISTIGFHFYLEMD